MRVIWVGRPDWLDHSLPEDADDGWVGLDHITLLVALRDPNSIVQMLVKLFLLVCQHLKPLEVIAQDFDFRLRPIFGLLLKDSVRIFLHLCEHLEVATIEELLQAIHS